MNRPHPHWSILDVLYTQAVYNIRIHQIERREAILDHMKYQLLGLLANII